MFRSRFGHLQVRKQLKKHIELFYVYMTVHRSFMSISVQQDATIHSLFYLQTVLHVSGGLYSI